MKAVLAPVLSVTHADHRKRFAGAAFLHIFGAVALLVSFITFVNNRAHAQEVSDGTTLEATLSQDMSWSTNPLMALHGARSLWGSTTSPQLSLTKKTPLSLYGLNFKVNQNAFNQPEYNSTDLYAQADFVRQNQRWKIDLPKTISYDTTRTSETVGYNVQAINSRHLGFSVSPQVSFSPSPRNTWSLSGAATLSEYEKKDYFTDYETVTASPSFERKFDPNNSGFVNLKFRRYQTTRDNATRVDSVGGNLGWRTVLSPRLKADASLGAQERREYNYGVPIDSWTLNTIYSGNLSFSGLQDNIDVSASRGQSPYGNGTEALETSFSFSNEHKLNEAFSYNISASFLMADYQKASEGDMETLTNGHIGLSYKIIKNIDFTAGYNFRYETRTYQTETVKDSTISVGLIFRPNMWTLDP